MDQISCKKKGLAVKLEVILITYNREKKLKQTLQALSDSPVFDLCVTIYDNASTDSTGDVCRDFCSRHPLWVYIQRDLNIGAPATYVDAVAHSKKPYVWVICDDDNYDFSGWEELVEAIERGEDAIFVSSHLMDPKFLGYRGTIDDWISKGGSYYVIASFVPCVVFRRAALPLDWKRNLYAGGGCVWPQMAIIEGLAAQSKSIFVLKAPIVHRELADDYKTNRHIPYLIDWIHAVSGIKNKMHRIRAMEHYFKEINSPSKSCYLTIPRQCVGLLAVDLVLGAISYSNLALIRRNVPQEYFEFRLYLAILTWVPTWALPSLVRLFLRPTYLKHAEELGISADDRW